MSSEIQALILALIQGLTEFLPVSSSAHLILPFQLFGWPDQGQAFDVAVHLGTLIAVIAYFNLELRRMTAGTMSAIKTRTTNQEFSLALAVVVGTIPAVIFGGLFNNFIEEHLRSSFVIACATIVFGLLLWMADKTGKEEKNETQISLDIALLIGVAQALALIPGTSRSGITITAALFLGFTRVTAARFSMLLSIPIILAAGSLESVKLMVENNPVSWGTMGLGIFASAISAFLCIHVFLKFIERMGMLPFVIYRLLLGAFLLIFIGLG